jgi:hypothetical protein
MRVNVLSVLIEFDYIALRTLGATSQGPSETRNWIGEQGHS